MIDFVSCRQLDEFESWKIVLSAFMVWCSYYAILRTLFFKETPEYTSRLVAGTYGLLTAYLGSRECFSDWTFSKPDQRTTDSQEIIFVISLGYFLEDTLWCFYYQTESLLMLVHHCFSCFAVYRLINMEKAGGQSACGLGVLELTNPFLQIRWFLRYYNYHKTLKFYITEIIFVCMFVTLRLIIGTEFVYLVLKNPNTTEFCILTVIIYVISWMFMVNIVMYLKRKYFSKPKETSRLQNSHDLATTT